MQYATGVVLIVLLLLIPSDSFSSVVVHTDREGIVAHADRSQYWLDSNGHVWGVDDSSPWLRVPEFDPPLPVRQIHIWDYYSFVTTDNEVWLKWEDTEWMSLGHWPGSAAALDTDLSRQPSLHTVPSPSFDTCTIQVDISAPGLLRVDIVDCTGRLVRRLVDANLPPGHYTPVWDGCDQDGVKMAAGVYGVLIESELGIQRGRLVLVR